MEPRAVGNADGREPRQVRVGRNACRQSIQYGVTSTARLRHDAQWGRHDGRGTGAGRTGETRPAARRVAVWMSGKPEDQSHERGDSRLCKMGV